jgi:hypothetical protein
MSVGLCHDKIGRFLQGSADRASFKVTSISTEPASVEGKGRLGSNKAISSYWIQPCFFFLFNCFYIYSHVYTLFVLSPPHLQAEPVLPSCLLRFWWRENISDKKKDIAFLLVWDKDSYPSVASMHMYITTHIDSSLPDLFTASWSPSHNGLCQFKITLFAPLQWAHQPHSSFGFPSLSLFLLHTFSL